MTENGDTGMAMLSHILALFAGFLAPLVIYLLTDDEFAKENATNSLNWQITVTIAGLISAVLTVVFIGLLFIPILILLDIVFVVLATVKASNGEAWDYPLTYDFL